jgi:tripartite-type tricarboxylate transporter receptor subunit TctC
LNKLVGRTGIAGPADLPDDIAAKWGEWMAAATQDAKFNETMSARGSVIELMDPVAANEFIQGQYNIFRALVDELGMRIEG